MRAVKPKRNPYIATERRRLWKVSMRSLQAAFEEEGDYDYEWDDERAERAADEICAMINGRKLLEAIERLPGEPLQ